jgi:flagellin
MNAIEATSNNQRNIRSSLEKLSSGLHINKASDDASGLAIADKLRTQKNSLTQGIDNANSAVAMIQIADKAMAEQSNILDIVKAKMIQAATATTSSEGRDALAKDMDKLLNQLDNIASQTNYNGVSLLQKSNTDTGASVALTFQMGETSSDTIVSAGSVMSNTNGLDNLLAIKSVVSLGTISTVEAQNALEIVDNAIDDLNTFRSDFGSTQNQIESAMRNMMTATTNIAAAESVIRDVDFAEESAHLNKLSILGSASTYAQSQANAVPQSVLKLLV